MTSFKVFWRTGTHDSEFFLSLPELERRPYEFSSRTVRPHYGQVKPNGIIAKKNRRTENYNFNDVFLCVAVVVA